MSKKIENEEKKSKKHIGAFIGGSFFGILLTLVILAGTLCFAYFKVSPNWINKTFKTNIDLGSDEANNKTIKDFVNGAIQLSSNLDGYTLNDLKRDFGISVSDKVYGFDISDLKDVPLSNLGTKVEEKINSITAYELDQIEGIDMEGLESILSKKNTYLYNETTKKLTYQDLVEVDFAYSINNEATKVTVKGKEYAIVSGKVQIDLWSLPIFIAMEDFIGNMGNQLTLSELETDFGVVLPEILSNADKANITINQLEDVINDLTVADFLSYTVDTTTEPGKTIVKNKEGIVVTGVDAALATFKIGNIGEGINSLTVLDVFGEEEFSTGVLKLIDKNTKIEDVPTAINEKMKNITLGELIDNRIVELNFADTLSFNEKRGQYIAGTNTRFEDLSIAEMISYILDLDVQ